MEVKIFKDEGGLFLIVLPEKGLVLKVGQDQAEWKEEDDFDALLKEIVEDGGWFPIPVREWKPAPISFFPFCFF